MYVLSFPPGYLGSISLTHTYLADSPYAIGAWFFPQQIIELMYIREFFRPAGQIEKIVLDFAPFFVLGNFMIGTWPIPVSGGG